MDIKPISLRVDKDKLLRIDHLAGALGRSRNWALNQAIDKYLDYEEWFVMEVTDGIEESNDAKNVVSNSELQNQLEQRLTDRLDKKVDS